MGKEIPQLGILMGIAGISVQKLSYPKLTGSAHRCKKCDFSGLRGIIRDKNGMRALLRFEGGVDGDSEPSEPFKKGVRKSYLFNSLPTPASVSQIRFRVKTVFQQSLEHPHPEYPVQDHPAYSRCKRSLSNLAGLP